MTATKLKLAFSAVLVASAATAIVTQHQNLEKLHQQSALLQQQLAQLETEKADLSNQLASAGNSSKLTDDQFNELLKLRGEVGVLRQQTAGFEKLREENQRLQAIQNNANLQEQANVAAKEQERQDAYQRMNRAKAGMLGVIMFANDNQSICPVTIDQVANYLGTNAVAVETNFDLVYQGSVTNITNPSGTIVLKENQAWLANSGKWAKTYGFADGHSEIHTEPDGNFDIYEKDHIVVPPASR